MTAGIVLVLGLIASTPGEGLVDVRREISAPERLEVLGLVAVQVTLAVNVDGEDGRAHVATAKSYGFGGDLEAATKDGHGRALETLELEVARLSAPPSPPRPDPRGGIVVRARGLRSMDALEAVEAFVRTLDSGATIDMLAPGEVVFRLPGTPLADPFTASVRAATIPGHSIADVGVKGAEVVLRLERATEAGSEPPRPAMDPEDAPAAR